MARLSQINALIAGEKKASGAALTALHHLVQRNPETLGGVIRTYQPRDDEGEQLPPERKNVQTRIRSDVIRQCEQAMTRMLDLQLIQDAGNRDAVADIVIDGRTLLADVPVTYLLFLKKTLVDLHTFIGKLPTLDPAETWTWDPDLGVYRSAPAQTVRSKKVPRNHVVAEATDRHPAQVQVWQEDAPQGNWTTVKLSGALPTKMVRQLERRVNALIDAVQIAQDNANTVTAPERTAGRQVLGYLFDDITGADD